MKFYQQILSPLSLYVQIKPLFSTSTKATLIQATISYLDHREIFLTVHPASTLGHRQCIFRTGGMNSVKTPSQPAPLPFSHLSKAFQSHFEQKPRSLLRYELHPQTSYYHSNLISYYSPYPIHSVVKNI